MSNHEQLLEDYEDACFALLMESVAKQEGQRLEELNQQLLNDPAFAIPESTNQRCLKTISRCFAHQQYKATVHSVFRILHFAAIVVAITVLVFTSAFAISEDFRIVTRNLLISASEKYTEFRMDFEGQVSSNTHSSHSPGALFKRVDVNWMPEGFQLHKNQYDHWAYFENEAGEWIQILTGSADTSIQLDTEDATVLDVTIHDLPAVVVEKGNQITILLTDIDRGFFFTIVSQGVNYETLKNIGENLIIW